MHMAAIVFDSLIYANNLQQAGFSERQAEVLAEENTAAIESNFASKQDLNDLEYY